MTCNLKHPIGLRHPVALSIVNLDFFNAGCVYVCMGLHYRSRNWIIIVLRERGPENNHKHTLTQKCIHVYIKQAISYTCFIKHTISYTRLQSLTHLQMCKEWPRPIGCLKLQAIFRKRATNHRALLRKITDKDKASYGSSPLCISAGVFRLQHLQMCAIWALCVCVSTYHQIMCSWLIYRVRDSITHLQMCAICINESHL